MRKYALIIIGVVLGLFIVAGVLWVPGYDRAGVHPARLAIEEPLQSAKAHHYIGDGSQGLELVDARGKAHAFSLLPERRGGGSFFVGQMFLGVSHWSQPGGVHQPCSEDSQRYLAILIDKYAGEGFDRHFCLWRLRNAPLDRLRRWWYFKTLQH